MRHPSSLSELANRFSLERYCYVRFFCARTPAVALVAASPQRMASQLGRSFSVFFVNVSNVSSDNERPE